jgi:FAD-dependent urate hydroxylase
MTNGTVAVIGAGPYGLSTASHLLDAGVATRVFGETMGFWRNRMPTGMLLRSEWDGSNIAGPDRSWTLDQYEAEHGLTLSRRLPLQDFIAYGEWFQRRAVPNVDPRRVEKVEPNASGFRLELDDSEAIQVERVVVATGLESFAVRPGVFHEVSPERAPHSSEVTDPAQFAGESVVVVGGGQSALELAAILHEAGAEVEVVVRAPQVHWLNGRVRRYAGPLRKLIFPPGEIGPMGMNWIIEYPNIFRRLPDDRQKQITKRGLRPAGSGWLRPRLADVKLTVGRSVKSATPVDHQLRIELDDQTTREVDRVVLATGYTVDVNGYPFLAPEVTRAIRTRGGLPLLNDGFESSVPGLHFVGAVGTESFGPLLRFVDGTKYTAKAVKNAVLQVKPAPATATAFTEPATD